ncbi:methyltransferase domain-containing protein [Rhodobacteraceae bacterium]|nr:methyltransferase domain-containing protein [Paracoccaceae bacterium]
MIPLVMSSGDLLADRRAEYGESCLPDNPEAACDLYRQALELAPDWAAGWFRLGEIRADAGINGAADAFGQAIAADPADRLGAGLKRDLLRPKPLGDAMPAAFVEALFDQYATSFDTHLCGQLDYRAPSLMARSLGAGYGRMLDLGCGTGLMGEVMRPRAAYMEGWDLSAEMLRAADAKGLYDALHKCDVAQLTPAPPQWDLVTAADVFAYVGALERVVAWVGHVLLPQGQFAFTVEAHDGPEPFRLQDSRRYAHTQKYLTDLMAHAGFEADITAAVLRMDRGAPIRGYVVHAIRASIGSAPDRERHAEIGV